VRSDDAFAKEPQNWQPESREGKRSHWHTFDYEIGGRLVKKQIFPPVQYTRRGTCDNHYVMTSLLKVLRKLFRMCLLSSCVRSEAPNANPDFELSLRHFRSSIKATLSGRDNVSLISLFGIK
jgi:hypothetical protein